MDHQWQLQGGGAVGAAALGRLLPPSLPPPSDNCIIRLSAVEIVELLHPPDTRPGLCPWTPLGDGSAPYPLAPCKNLCPLVSQLSQPGAATVDHTFLPATTL